MTRVRAQCPPVAIVAIGGALGTFARFLAGPDALLLVNTLGAGLLGLLAALVPCSSSFSRRHHGSGFLGAFTSFSALSAAVVEADSVVSGATYMTASLALGLVAAGAGLWLGAKVRPAATADASAEAEAAPGADAGETS
ncbi:MAG TPA: CrcB family protein [Candidatus Corynebacterium gallistercoris]|uniref:Fluoride-specific ion channel n=1 Tax=Candidatus Corynebacterium gallistercoris TaxID=2838530 RepID=A0A9D1RZ89_9CORY|nr:CrcB family protein [Candidatus Corynebacterium gallistercoris]